MSYTITTVAELLGAINKSLYIPGIQRPYVWTQEQIIRLFDSLMRKYPIGTLLMWELPPEKNGDWEIYRFIKSFWEGDIHNDRVQPEVAQSYTLVLDGQQRLTSLLIGLGGTYTVKKKRMRKSTVDAWQEKALHINLAHAPDADDAIDEEDNPLAEHYHFKFYDVGDRPKNTSTELWFELGFIMSGSTPQDLDKFIANWVTNNMTLAEGLKPVAEANLRRLWEMVWRDKAMAHFTEFSSSYDRVLDIFIRANDGGTKLSRSDLLMSVITLRWEQFNAREETEELIQGITETLKPKRLVTREFLLRSALFLNDLDFSIQVKNFTPVNIKKLESNWQDVKQALLFTANWLKDHGLYGEVLGSLNVLMLLAYYFYRSGYSQGQVEPDPENEENIRGWLITLLYQQLLSTQTNSTLSTFRRCIRQQRIDRINFPVHDVMLGFTRNGRPMGFDQEWVNKYSEHRLDQLQSEKLLSLLYGRDIAAMHRRAVCLIQPRFFMPEELRRSGVPDAMAPTYENLNNKLVLGLALTEEELTHYYSLPFETWAQTLSEQWLDFHLLPSDISLYRIDRIPELARARYQLIQNKLQTQYPVPSLLSEPERPPNHGLELDATEKDKTQFNQRLQTTNVITETTMS